MNHCHFFWQSRNPNDTVCLKTFVLASQQFCFWFSCLADQQTPKTEPKCPALSVSEFNQPALTIEHFGREFTTVLACHCPSDALDDCGSQSSIVFELFSAILHLNSHTFAEVLVIGTFICILKTATATHVVDQGESRSEKLNGLFPSSASIRTISFPRRSASSRFTSS